MDQMLAHLVDAFRMGLGEITVRPRRLFVRYWPLNWIFANLLRFPRNLPTVPEIVSRKKASIEEELVQLEAAMTRFAARKGSTTWPEHPALGRLSGNSCSSGRPAGVGRLLLAAVAAGLDSALDAGPATRAGAGAGTDADACSTGV